MRYALFLALPCARFCSHVTATYEAASETVAAQLVRAAGAGDRDAERELCRRFTVAVRTFARRRLRTEDAVAELTQDVMLLFIQALRAGSIEDPERVGGFVLGICRNLARDRARAAERRAELWEQFAGALAAVDHDAPEHAGKELARLEDCLSQISERSREVIRYAYVEGAPSAVIAERLAMSEGNVRIVRHRTLRALRECMASSKVSWEAA